MSRSSFLAPHPFARLLFGGWLLAIFAVTVGSLLPADVITFMPGGGALSVNDKATHFLAYTLLAVLPIVSVERLVIAMALAGAMAPLGIAIEFLQLLVPGRSCEVGDMAADILGICCGIAVATTLRFVQRVAHTPAAGANGD